ncbi:MAG: hypothetical protein LUD72_04560 [Bacteroidales bacterium]|nr:hypothetical protein [Bacteroidales bacterium]
MWRWDQGRLLYFQFNVLREMAGVLAEFDNNDIKECDNAFRECLERRTGMPFLPKSDTYAIKRNYSRVFQCGFLANFVGDKLVVTDICRDLAEGGRIQNADDFFFNYVRRFRFPFPAFRGYNATEERAYPFCAIIKFLFSLAEKGEESKVSLDDIFNYIIANNCNGAENIGFYKTLSPKNYEPSDFKGKDEARDVFIQATKEIVL